MSNVEKYLNEGEQIDLWNTLDKKQNDLARKVAASLKWGIEDTYAFVLELMTQVNAHSAAQKVEKIFLADLKR